MSKKLIIVWICHLTSSDIQNRLNTRKRITEFAPWIRLGIEEVKRRNEIDLHIISPHRWISGIKEFDEKNIFYHFFNPGIPFLGRHWPRFFKLDVLTNFVSNRRKIRNLVFRIQPDLIHLHGVENAYYSSSILDLINKYPTLVTIQGFISLVYRGLPFSEEKISFLHKRLVNKELQILRTVKNFGVRDTAMKDLILKYNHTAIFFWHEYFINIPADLDEINSAANKFYDIIFFTKLIKSKGIEDLILAVGIIKNIYPKLKVAIIGSSKSNYLDYLKQLASDNGCLENLNFLGFIPKQDDIYPILKKSKIFVLPTYVGDVAGGMIESMVRKVPVVTYKTGGIPEVNSKSHNIEIVDQGDIKELASRILFLLEDPSYAVKLANCAFKYATARWSNQKAYNDILGAYKSILKI